MAPSRKKRSSSGEEDDEEASPPKRQVFEEEEVPSEEDEAPETNKEEEYSNVEDDEEEDEEMEDESSPPPTKAARKPINKEGKPPEAGVIKEVYVENFMCHQKLRVPLCRNVNFINGQNGSGKSAILAAIQICLGAGARRTHRARNIKDLVRKDGNVTGAKVQVTLLNGGGDGYKQDIYGQTITVERQISLNGGYNGYKLLDENMKERSRSKKDLDEMLDTLNIQVENPVSVLDQEESKKFLTGKPGDKYAFFMKATELERIDMTYSSASDKIEELQDAQEKISRSIEKDQENMLQAKKRWEQHQALEKIQRKVAESRVKYAWAAYKAADSNHQIAVEEMAAFKGKAQKKQEELSQLEQLASQPDEEHQRKTDQINELIQEGQEQANLKRELEGQLKKAQEPIKQLKHQLKALNNQKKSEAKKLIAAQKRLDEARQQFMEQAGSKESEAARRAETLAQCEANLTECREKVDELKQAVHECYRGYEELEPEVKAAKERSTHAERKLADVKNTIENLQQKGDEFAMLGRNVKAVYTMIEKAKKAGKFKGKVVGPIGKYVKIAPGKEQFAVFAELALGYSTLDRFIVTNDEDRILVNEIRTKARCQRDCGLFQMNDLARFQVPPPPHAEIETIASVLAISDDLVYNCLVDQARIDQIALALGKSTAEKHLLFQRNDGGYYLQGNIKSVTYGPDGDQLTVNGGNPSYFANEKKVRKTIGVDKRMAIEESQREAAQLKAELQNLKKEESKLELEHRARQKKWNAANHALKENDTRILELSEKIEETRAEMPTTADEDLDTSEYEEEVALAQQEVDRLKTAEDERRAELEALAPDVEDIESRLAEVVKRNEKVLADMGRAQEEMQQFLATQSQQQDKIDKKKNKLAQYLEVVSKHQEKVDALAAEREEALNRARKFHYKQMMTQKTADQEGGVVDEEAVEEATEEDLAEINCPESVDKDMEYYKAKIESGMAKLEKERQRRKMRKEDPAAAYQAYMQAKEIFKAKNDQLVKISGQIEELALDLKKRKRRWLDMRSHLEHMTAEKFDDMLNLNKYSGKLRFDHESESLDLEVQKGTDNSSNTATKDVKGLSGGERSFTTICLLLALGEKLETPFRILDEFDVFLDAQARKLAMSALIHMAKKMEHRQFIFITPQDLSSLNPDPKLFIHKLRPPVRHNTVGGPTQQTLDFSSQR